MFGLAGHAGPVTHNTGETAMQFNGITLHGRALKIGHPNGYIVPMMTAKTLKVPAELMEKLGLAACGALPPGASDNKRQRELYVGNLTVGPNPNPNPTPPTLTPTPTLTLTPTLTPTLTLTPALTRRVLGARLRRVAAAQGGGWPLPPGCFLPHAGVEALP